MKSDCLDWSSPVFRSLCRSDMAFIQPGFAIAEMQDYVARKKGRRFGQWRAKRNSSPTQRSFLMMFSFPTPMAWMAILPRLSARCLCNSATSCGAT